MRRLGSSTLAAALVVAAFPAAADPHPGHGPPSVYIADLKYQPDQLTVYTGDAVVWIWNGPDTNHSVTASDGSFDSDPSGSPNHAIGDAFSHTFDKPGTFTYACKVHSFMQGTVTVKPLPNAPPDPAATATAPSISGFKATLSGARTLLRFTLSAAADVNATIARSSGGKVLREVDFSAKSGAVRRRVSFGHLRRGRYRVKVVAVDPSSGLASPAAKATVQVRR
jgi:plastocyanin